MLYGLAGDSAMILAAMPEWVSSGWSILLMVLGFSLVIFVHELGHFLAAKWAGVRVDRFAIGFGKELFGFTKGETRYSFNALPLGGYVKMLGQEDFVVDKTGELKVKNDPNAFSNKPVGKRMVIISAGVIMNLFFAAIAFTIVVMVGRLESPPVVGEVMENSPAGRAQLQTGDVVKSINGQTISSFSDLSMYVMLSDPDEELVFGIERNGKLVEPPPRVQPEFRKEAEVRQVGIAGGMNRRIAMPGITFDAEPTAVEPRPDELHLYDELHALFVDDKPVAQDSIAAFRRAIVAARGEPVEVLVKRPVNPDDLTQEACLEASPKIDTNDAVVRIRATWAPISDHSGDLITGSLLGLTPRLTILAATPNRAFDLAGVKSGDVIVRLGSRVGPTYADVKSLIVENPDKPLELEVQRTRAANHGLDAFTVEWCVIHRENLITAGLTDAAAGKQRLRELLGSSDLPVKEQESLLAKTDELKDGTAWRRWFENVDVHKLKPVTPRRPFALFKQLDPKVDAVMRCMDEDHLVVASVKEQVNGQPSAAKQAGLQDGVIILSAAGIPVRQWYQLSEVFRTHAGQTIDITYRTVDQVQTAKMTIPGCVSASLGLAIGDRIISIDGKRSFPIEDDEGVTHNIALPDWRAVSGLLREAEGRTVEIKYKSYDEETHTAQYTPTATNSDPWLQRVFYAPAFACFPLLERNPIRNPITAMGVGFQRAYRITVSTVQTIRHLIFTRKVGTSKIQGPVGILRIGKSAADSSPIDLLWFLAILSANLAVINFLPLPIVDGGLFLFLILEKIRGEPVSIKTQVATQIVGIMLIVGVFVLVTYQDIKNWIVGA